MLVRLHVEVAPFLAVDHRSVAVEEVAGRRHGVAVEPRRHLHRREAQHRLRVVAVLGGRRVGQVDVVHRDDARVRRAKVE
eukprot:4001010-Prymnesium_polylepis.1